MTLPASGAITFANVNTELGAAVGTARTLNDSAVRTLFGKASGVISMSDGYGKANAWTGTISTNQTNMNLRTWALANGWNGTTAATVIVNTGVYVYSTAAGTPAMTIDGTWPGGLTLINNGYILGCGGQGGGYGGTATGNAGGHAISLGVSCTITNNNYIAGGGGGGGRSGTNLGGGGGAGGGLGGTTYTPTDSWHTAASVASSAGGAVGARGTQASSVLGYNMGSLTIYAGASGGRVLPGVGGFAGDANCFGAGGQGGGYYQDDGYSNTAGETGGAGGSGSAVGANGIAPYYGGGGGGGWGAAGGTSYTGNAGGAGGKCVALNGFTVTWSATGTRYGAIS